MAAIYFTPLRPAFLGQENPGLFAGSLLAYLAGNLIILASMHRLKAPLTSLVMAAAIFDVLLVTLLMHASGGVASGLGVMLAVTSAGSGLLLPPRASLGVAAASTIAVLGEQLYRQGMMGGSADHYVQAGILGAIFFFSATTASILARRTAQSEAEARIRAQALDRMRQLNERVIQFMKTGVLVIDESGRIEQHNRAAWRYLGMPERIDRRHLRDVSRPLFQVYTQWHGKREFRPPPVQAAGRGPILNVSFQRFGDERNTTLIFLEDRSLIAQTAQHMKLASLGRLTASIAHEIRNPLGALSHAAQLLNESEALNEEDRSLVNIILSHAKRMNTIIVNIMNLSQRKEAEIRPVRLKTLLSQFVDDFVLNREPRPEIHYRLEPDDIVVEFDISQLIQVLTNLCENAVRYSYQKTKRPTVTMVAGIKYEDKTAYLDVLDEGPGVHPKYVEHIFEPFFSASGTSATPP
jgi:two-component system sensor histidine kinase PilS (NtrC family)